MSDWTAVIDKVDCPRCGAYAGKRCHNGKDPLLDLIHIPHTERLLAWKEITQAPVPGKGKK
jgi:hypothetical protein